MTKTALRQYLTQRFTCQHKRQHSIEYWLIRFVCRGRGYSPQGQLEDIVHHGCSSGCVGELIYTCDCLKFYQKYEDKIWELVYEFRQDTGQTLGQFIDSFSSVIEDEDSLKVSLGWFAIEQTAFRILNDLGGN